MTKTRRSMVSKGAMAMVALFAGACHGGGGTENTGEGVAVEVTT